MAHPDVPSEQLVYQLTVFRLYETLRAGNCGSLFEGHQEMLVSLTNPSFEPLDFFGPDLLNDDEQRATFYLPPGESVFVTLRIVDPDPNDAVFFEQADLR